MAHHSHPLSWQPRSGLGGGHAEVSPDVHVQPLIFPPPRDDFFRVGQNFFDFRDGLAQFLNIGIADNHGGESGGRYVSVHRNRWSAGAGSPKASAAIESG